jgi:LysR family glycine cleavage system transcriptional activator
LPRLPDFRARHPGVDLVIDASSDVRRLGEDADLGLRFGNGDWPGTQARLLLRTPVVVIAAPELVPPGAVRTLDELAGFPWLQELGTNEATAFLHKNGLTRTGDAGFVSLPGNLMLDAARDGQGIAVIARAFVEGDITSGRLVVLHEDSEREGYFLVTPAGVQRPAVQAFCDWALRQSGAV